MTKNSQRQPFSGYSVIAGAFFSLLVYGATFYSFGVFFKPVLTEFGWSRAVTSGAFSLNAILYGLFAMVFGKLNERVKPRVIVTIAGVLFGLGFLLSSRVSAVWQLYLFYGVVIAMAMGAVYVLSLSAPVSWFVRRRGLMTGVVHAGLSVGGALMPTVASRLIISYGWRNSYIIVGLVAMAVVVIAAQFLKRSPGEYGQVPYGTAEMNRDDPLPSASGLSFSEALRTWQFWTVSLIFLFNFFAVDAVIVHIVPHATDLGISATTAAGILGFMSGMGLLGKLVIGGASDRVGIKVALTISLVLMLAATFWLFAAKQAWMFYLFAVVFGFGYGGTGVLVTPMIAWIFGLKSPTTIFGTVLFLGAAGTMTGPILAGYIYDTTGSYALAFVVCAVLIVLTLLLGFRLKPCPAQQPD